MFKNSILSKKSMLAVAGSFMYSFLWIFLIKPEKFGIFNYTTEYFKLLYVVIVYLSFQLLEEEVKNNILVTLFTGVFTRVQIIISKFISLIFLGIYFAFIGELNNLIVCKFAENGFGISEFLKLNHVNIILSIILITFLMGSVCFVTLAFKLKSKTISTIATVLLSVLNFWSTLIVTEIEYLHRPITAFYKIYMKTPMYISAKLILKFDLSNWILAIGWGLLLFGSFMVIMDRKEIS